jgi:hypothetical protein
VDGVSGTIQEWPEGDMTGKIVLMKGFHAPHEKRLRQAQSRGALAVLLIREISFPPGFGMYSIDGSDRRKINIPVFEAGYGYKFDPSRRQTNTSSSLLAPGTQCNLNPKVKLNRLSSGDTVTIIPMENRHKTALDTPFQLIMSIFLSVWETSIVSFGIYRIHQLISFDPDSRIIAAAPICCALEVTGALLRLIYTCIDPFYTYRILPDPAAQSGITISFPFSFTAGVLLTFYCTTPLLSFPLPLTTSFNSSKSSWRGNESSPRRFAQNYSPNLSHAPISASIPWKLLHISLCTQRESFTNLFLLNPKRG